ncbi:DUF1206 domain-containing protein [Candidatus Laterigemmans baculatus]|uniref:DUF1206 domain-containing protein n=1 Tax=Candidatus Laterigemmans baculatus TaxID=2770505 RepID=UPI0013DA53C8|nr:DUF1206 domain-containing protein [Candidatus Laterigemmans baculatus]
MSQQVARTARTPSTGEIAEHGRKWIEYAGRAGYLTKGVVYLLIGGMAAAAGWGAGGRTTDSEGAISELAQQPFGTFLLWLVTIGLLGYCVWRIVEAITDPDGKGTDAKGIATRIGYVISGIAYGMLAWTVSPATGSPAGGGGGGSGQTQDTVGWLLSVPGGKWVLGAIGLAVAGFGLYQIYQGAADKFMDKYNAGGMSETQRKVAKYSGRLGLIARGITFGIIGFFLVLAARTLDPNKVKGTGEALDVLARQPYGQWILFAVGIGLFCYGIFCFVQARYSTFRVGRLPAGSPV